MQRVKEQHTSKLKVDWIENVMLLKHLKHVDAFVQQFHFVVEFQCM